MADSGHQTAAIETDAQATPEPENVARQIPPRSRRFRIRAFVVPYLLSVTFHSMLLIALAAWILPEIVRDELLILVTAKVEERTPRLDPLEVIEQPLRLEPLDVITRAQEDRVRDLVPRAAPQSMDFNLLEPRVDPALLAPDTPGTLLTEGMFAGRTESGRTRLLKASGGSDASERAVVLGLQWLSTIQREDGSWDFADVGRSSAPGRLTNPVGGTALSLLAYLGAGHTMHTPGPYRQTVERGLLYLIRRIQLTPAGADLRGEVQENEGMYVQAMACTALCEAYAISRAAYSRNRDGRDKTGFRRLEFQAIRVLKEPAQEAIRFVESTQDPASGGWKYVPLEGGDLSVTGWQFMALVSGRAAGLRVSDVAFRRVSRFLDSVSADDGARYGYESPEPENDTTSAIGLLCRMHLGWERDVPALERGSGYLLESGPAVDDPYFNYHATQVIHHRGSKSWDNWNRVMRERLTRSQRIDGPESGSWDPVGSYSEVGGRLADTCLSIMTLEVYYRHLPLYQWPEAAESPF